MDEWEGFGKERAQNIENCDAAPFLRCAANPCAATTLTITVVGSLVAGSAF